MADLLLHRLEQGVVHLGPMGGKHGHFPILQIAHLPGVLDDGGDVRGQQVEALSPYPSTRGESFRTATSRSGSSAQTIPRA